MIYQSDLGSGDPRIISSRDLSGSFTISLISLSAWGLLVAPRLSWPDTWTGLLSDSAIRNHNTGIELLRGNRAGFSLTSRRRRWQAKNRLGSKVPRVSQGKPGRCQGHRGTKYCEGEHPLPRAVQKLDRRVSGTGFTICRLRALSITIVRYEHDSTVEVPRHHRGRLDQPAPARRQRLPRRGESHPQGPDPRAASPPQR